MYSQVQLPVPIHVNTIEFAVIVNFFIIINFSLITLKKYFMDNIAQTTKLVLV